MPPFIALTDKAWFDFLAAQATDGVVDEVNFWSPRSLRPLKRMALATPVFFRLKRPHHAIAGYGFYASFNVVGLDDAWELFAWKNGDPDKARFLRRIGDYRGLDLLDPRATRDPLGCMVLRAARFWPRERWIPWGSERGWASNIVQGKTASDPANAELLLEAIRSDGLARPDDFAERFTPLVLDERLVAAHNIAQREGQAAFRLRLLDAYGGCAITGEKTQPVLDAAHIQPYLGAKSNHIQNGLVLTKEFHALYDRGYVSITPDRAIHVSPRLREEWSNGKRYYDFDRQQLRRVPEREELQPSPDALQWHYEKVFKRVS